MTSETGQAPSWVAVDWGTSNLRLWLMDDNDRPVRKLESAAGMSQLGPGLFEPVLIQLLEPWLVDDRVLPVICCGMVGARQGWSDAGYDVIPIAPGQHRQLHTVSSRDERLHVSIVPGIKQINPADVMRGEETQIAGLLRHSQALCGTICLPGTHTKWVHVHHGSIIHFNTCMTGELFSLLSRQSVLRHSMNENQWSDDAFDLAVTQVIDCPESMTRDLFALRAESLVNDVAGEQLRGRLSGLLIGSELAAMRHYWADGNVTITGESGLAGLYARALSSQGCMANCIDGDAMALDGLVSLFREQREH